MELKIEGYNIEQLEKLGEDVGVVGGGVSIEGNARKVGRIFLALGLFSDVVASLKKFQPAAKPLSNEQRMHGRVLGLSDSDMDQMRVGSSAAPAYQTILPSKKLPFGVVFPVGDNEERGQALASFRWTLSNFVNSISGSYAEGSPRREEACSMVEEYWRVMHDFLSEVELDYVFDMIIENGKSSDRFNNN